MTKVCQHCGLDYSRGGTHQKENSKYCSQKCYWAVRGLSALQTCGQCGCQFKNVNNKRAKYCTVSCSREAQSSGKSTVPPGKPKTCVHCGALFHRTGTKPKYCGNECYWASRKTGRKPNVRAQVTPKNWEKIKKSVLDRDNRICQKCNTQCPGKGDACVHHIVDREHNELHQLITVCRPCHTQITVVEQALFLLEEQGRDAFAPFVYKLQETK